MVLDNISVRDIHPKIMHSVKCMLSDLTTVKNKNAGEGCYLPFYGEFSLFLNYFNSKSLPTCGVNITNKGMNFYYNNDFVNGMTQKEVNFVVIHEIFHLLFNHVSRTIKGNYNHRLANVAQDMIINTIIEHEFPSNFVAIPKDKEGKNSALMLPKEYTGKPIFEYVYNWLSDKKDEMDNMTGEGSGKSRPDYGNYGQNNVDCHSVEAILENLDTTNGQYLDVHFDDDVAPELREQMINEIVERMRARGLSPGGVESILEQLRPKRKDHLKYIKRVMSNEMFGTTKLETITKPNRRGIKGIKGKKKVKFAINCILDTSGSMSGLFEKVLSHIFRNDIEVVLIQCDTEITAVNTIKNRMELKSLAIKGLGGTTIQGAVDLVAEKYNHNTTLILTDGYTDTLNFSRINKQTLIISTDVECPLSNGKGVKQIIVKD